MNREILISYAESFSSFILESEISKRITRIILFGSVARGDFDKESDIDIFIDTPNDIEKEVGKQLDLFNGSEINRRWLLKGVKNEISVKTGRLEKWSLRRDVISNGIILYGKMNDVPKEADYYLMVSMNFNKLNRTRKVSVWRKLYGYNQKVGDKVYTSKGLIKELDGKRLEKSIVVVPMGKRKGLIDFLKGNRVEYTLHEIWSDDL